MWLKIKPYIAHYIIFLIIFIFLIIGYRYFWYRTKVVIKPVVKTLTKIITKTKFKYKTLTSTKIKYIPKIEYKTKLPVWLKGNNNKIVATGTIPPYNGHTSVTAIFDTLSGSTSIMFKQLPYLMPKHKGSFFKLSNEFFIRGGIGYLTDKNGTVKSELIGLQYNFLSIGSINLKVQDNIYLNSRNTVNFLGVIAQYKF